MQKDVKFSPSATNSADRNSVERNSHQFPSSKRILRRARFQKVYHEGVRSGCGLFTVFIRPTDAPAASRVGITVTRKIGNAVIRNRAKRLFREAIRKHFNLLPDGVEIVLHARNAIVSRRSAEVEAEFVRVLPQAIRRALRG